MTKRYVDEQITISRTFTDSNGDASDPTAVTFTYRIEPDGTDASATPTNPSTGVYQVQITPDRAGNLYGYFKGTGAVIKTIPVHVPIHPKQLPTAQHFNAP